MPSYPTPSAYQEAVQFPETAFADPVLQTAEPRQNVLGLPQPITGAFAAVFPMTDRAGATWAVKCFLADVPDQRARYDAVAHALADADLPYTVAFDYQAEGIAVEGARYPVLKMAWAEGQPLNRFVAEHRRDAATLHALADAWAAMLRDLEDADLAHGDLQHGNILVSWDDAADAPRLTLVDYDTAFVPALAGRASAEVGHRNYQHPDRTDADFGPYLDRFPGLAVYTALHALARRPELWDRYDTDENVLFRDADFYDPDASALFAELDRMDDLRPLVEALRTACYVEPEAVPPLAHVLSGEAEGAWVAEAPRARDGHPRRARPREGVARWFVPGAVGVLALAILAGVAGTALGLAAWWLAWVVLGVGLAAGGAAAWRGYRQQPLVRRRRRLRQEIEHFDGVLGNLRRQIDALAARRDDVLQTVETRRAERLEEMREEARFDHLKHHFIGEAGAVEGVSHKAVVRLKASGIRTAYEAKPARIDEVRRLSDTTRARLKMWRAGLLAEIEDTMPERLSPAEERRIHRYVQHRADDLEAEQARARQKVRVQQDERARLAGRLAELPALSFGRYVRYLLRLSDLPNAHALPPAPPPAAEPPAAETDDAPPPPSAEDDERPWWQTMQPEQRAS